jgi:hypothetical protein
MESSVYYGAKQVLLTGSEWVRHFFLTHDYTSRRRSQTAAAGDQEHPSNVPPDKAEEMMAASEVCVMCYRYV